MKFDQIDESGRKYYDVIVPAGFTFRTYEDDPYTKIQIKNDDEPTWFEAVYVAYENGALNHKDPPKRNPKDKGTAVRNEQGLWEVHYLMGFDEK